MFDHGHADVRYNPALDAALRWADWTFAFEFVGNGSEYIDVDRRRYFLDVREWGTRRPAGIAHALAHLDLEHHKLKSDLFTVQHESDAEGIARLWMDRRKGAALFININSI